jgi:hypothetical protein
MDRGIAYIIAAVVLAGGLWLGANALPEGNLGGVPGVSLYPQSVTTFTQGGGVTSTTTNATSTVPATDLDTENYLSVGPTAADIGLTLPASTSFAGVPNAGDLRTLVIENAATTTYDINLKAGTGIDLQEPDGQNVVIANNNYVILTCVRMANTDIMCVADETIPAD